MHLSVYTTFYPPHLGLPSNIFDKSTPVTGSYGALWPNVHLSLWCWCGNMASWHGRRPGAEFGGTEKIFADQIFEW